MSSIKESQNSSRAFRLVMIWSAIMLFVAILFDFIYRVIYPIELHLNESEYTERVFVETETSAW